MPPPPSPSSTPHAQLLPDNVEKHLLEQSKFPAWLFDVEQLRILWANQAAVGLWEEKTLAHLLQRDFASLPAASLARLRDWLATVSTGKDICEPWTLFRDGRPVSLLCSCAGVRLGDGRLALFMQTSVFEDRWQSLETLRGVEALHYTPVKISMFTLDGVALMHNAAAREAFDPWGDLDETLSERFVDPAQAERIVEDLRSGWAVSQDALVFTQLGERLHHIQAVRTTDPATGAPAIIVNQHDVTTEREAQRAQQVSERRFRLLCTQAPIGITECSTDGACVFVNEHWCKIAGISHDEALGSGWLSALHPDDRERVRETCQQAVEVGAGFAFEFRFVHADGTQRWVSANGVPMRDEHGALCGFLATLADITERMSSEQRSRLLFEQSSEAHFFLNEVGQVRDCNHAALKLYGAEHKDEIVGKTPQTYSPALQADGTDSTELAMRMFGLAEQKRSHRFEWLIRQRDGAELTAEVTLTALAFEGRRAFLAVARDQTELKRVQAAIVKSRETAFAALRTRSQFLANMSHEIRTPMNGVMGMLELALGTSLTSEQREFLAAAHASAEGLLRIINDILDLSKLEVDKVTLESIELSLETLLRDTLRASVNRAHAKGLELLVSLDPALPAQVEGDPVRLRQVLTNLIENAVKFTDAGEIALSVRAVAVGRTPMLEFAVRDSGIGIEPHNLERIFGAFSQADASTTRRFGGTGLGLAISKQLAQLMGGDLTVSSERARGSTFTLRIPLRTRASAVPWAAASPTPEPRTVLLIEDHPGSAHILTGTLARLDLTVTHARSLAEAATLVAQQRAPFDFALVDQSLPGEDPAEFGPTLDALGLTRPLRMILLESRRGVASAEHGFVKSLRKPLLPGDLSKLLAPRSDHDADADRDTGTSPLAPKLRKLRVLMAEDHPINAHFLSTLLRREGHVVVHAVDGAQALLAARTSTFDVVLLDVEMPVMDGLETARRIRALPAPACNVPLVALTANAMKGDDEACLAAGMDRYLSKPVQGPLLFRALSELLASVPGTGRRASQQTLDGGRPSTPLVVRAEEAPAPAAAAPAFSRQELLARACGDARFMGELLQVFVNTQSELMNDLETGVAANDTERVRRDAHRFKGALQLVCADPAAKVAADLERAARAGRAAEFAAHMTSLRGELRRLMTELGQAG